MCLIKVYCINVNSCLNNAMQTVICGEDDAMLSHCIAHFHKQFDTLRTCSLEVFSITTVNMQHISIINVLQKVSTELISKQQSWCYNNNGSGNFDLKTPHSILDLNQSFTTTSGNNNLTQRITAQGIKCSLLMGTKSNQLSVCL